MKQLLSVSPRLDGVVCYNDAIAVGAIKAILEAGSEVPCDIEVVGAGNVHYSDILRIPLSTIDLNSASVGQRAAEILLRRSNPRSPGPERVCSVRTGGARIEQSGSGLKPGSYFPAAALPIRHIHSSSDTGMGPRFSASSA